MSLTLTKKSIFSASSSLIDTFLRTVIALAVTPIITHGLGVKSYGSWIIITQLFAYLSLANLNAGSTLKIRLSVIQHDPEPEPKQKLLSAAFRLFKYSILISLLFCFVVIMIAPFLFSDNLDEITNIRFAILIGTLGIIFEQFGGIAGNALRGNNLDYKGLGIRSIIIILSNSIIVLLVVLKFGIIGLSIASLVGSIAFCILWFLLAKRELRWFKQLKATGDELKIYARQSALTLGHSLGNYLLTNMDAVLIGIVMGSKFAAKYFISITIFRTFFFPLINTLNTSSGTGLAFLFGSENWTKAKEVISQLIKVSLIFSGAAGFFYILFNKEIVHFWVGDDFYSSERLEYYFVIFCILQCVYNLIHYVVDGLQMFKIKARISGSLGVGFVLLSIPLLYTFGLKGIVIAASSIRILGIYFLVSYVNNQVPGLIPVRLVFKQFLAIGVILIVAYYLAIELPVMTLMPFLLVACCCALVLAIAAYVLIPSSFKQRIKYNLPFKFK